jgi:hypothetical protein
MLTYPTISYYGFLNTEEFEIIRPKKKTRRVWNTYLSKVSLIFYMLLDIGGR